MAFDAEPGRATVTTVDTHGVEDDRHGGLGGERLGCDGHVPPVQHALALVVVPAASRRISANEGPQANETAAVRRRLQPFHHDVAARDYLAVAVPVAVEGPAGYTGTGRMR